MSRAICSIGHLGRDARRVVGRHAPQREGHARLGHRRDAVLRHVRPVALQHQARACSDGGSGMSFHNDLMLLMWKQAVA
jgi:hypothetical protein